MSGVDGQNGVVAMGCDVQPGGPVFAVMVFEMASGGQVGMYQVGGYSIRGKDVQEVEVKGAKADRVRALAMVERVVKALTVPAFVAEEVGNGIRDQRSQPQQGDEEKQDSVQSTGEDEEVEEGERRAVEADAAVDVEGRDPEVRGDLSAAQSLEGGEGTKATGTEAQSEERARWVLTQQWAYEKTERVDDRSGQVEGLDGAVFGAVTEQGYQEAAKSADGCGAAHETAGAPSAASDQDLVTGRQCQVCGSYIGFRRHNEKWICENCQGRFPCLREGGAIDDGTKASAAPCENAD